VPKKNGKMKFCVDFKKLNKATKKDPYPLPFSNEVPLLHIVPFCEGPNEKPEGFAKQKQKT
jgi:hypothetical protein